MMLLEMLLAMLIGIVVITSVLVLYVNAQESAAYLNSASRVQESGRFATDHLARTMRMAGYDDPITTQTASVTPSLEGTTSADVNISMVGFVLKPGTDVVQISHEGAPQVRDCQGVAVAADVWVTNTYAISNNDELICATQRTATTMVEVCTALGVCSLQPVTTTSESNPTIIAEGVEGMNVLYGIDSDTDGVANRYVPQADVTDWLAVVSAKATLLVNSVENVFAETLHGCKSCDTFNPTASNMLRGEFQTTVRFRNL
jgi:type IV pilus assembly protein PilW